MLLPAELLRLADTVIDSLDFDLSQCTVMLILLQLLSNHYCKDLTEESLHKLHDVFPDSLILAALDLIDQRKGFCFYQDKPAYVPPYFRSIVVTESVTPWGFVEYEVLSSTATHIVYVGLPKTLMSSYCTCPAFNFTVLETGQSLMVGQPFMFVKQAFSSPSDKCKHVLATRLAIRLGLCVKQQISLDYLATSVSLRYQR